MGLGPTKVMPTRIASNVLLDARLYARRIEISLEAHDIEDARVMAKEFRAYMEADVSADTMLDNADRTLETVWRLLGGLRMSPDWPPAPDDKAA